MKKILNAIFSLCAVCTFAVTAYGEEMLESYDWVYKVKDDGTAVITVPAGAAVNNSEILVPYEIDGYSVTEIGSDCFTSQNDITSVKIPETVTKIDSRAFLNCYSLDSVSFMSDYVLYEDGISSATDAERSEENEIRVIGAEAFKNCYELDFVYFSSGVKRIETEAFSHCLALEWIFLPHGTESIGDNAFTNCLKLSSVTLPVTIKELGKDIFDNCSPYMTIYYDGTKEDWNKIEKDESDFENITVLWEESVAEVVDEKNGTCGKFTYNVLDDGTAEIVRYDGYDGDVKFPSEVNGYTVTKIGPLIFDKRSNLHSVEIPSTVKILDDCFGSCDELETVTLHEGLEVIGPEVFRRCESLKSITIPSTVTEIGDSAFYDCETLTEIVIPDNVRTIGDRVFYGCKNLEKVSLGKNIKEIKKFSFSKCKKLTRIEIPDGVTSIEEEAFFNCEKLTEIVIPVSVTKIGENVFYGCNNLERVLYKGTEKEWKKIFIHYDNKPLFMCLRIFEYDPETYKPIGPEFAIIICGVIIAAAVVVVLVFMFRKGKTCPECGKKLDEDSEFCGWCGKEL